ncbi:DUF3017 domain-containing protein [Streptomyces sp. NPDC018693]|uniref:DUF3017 domain-containing protein n=1 Tax=unclassified Streptomyces TaxID=2593676 RepID=UPI0037B06C5C
MAGRGEERDVARGGTDSVRRRIAGRGEERDAAQGGTESARRRSVWRAERDGDGVTRRRGARRDAWWVEESDASRNGAGAARRRGTRRFPRFTRDTARPEGGGRAAPRDAPAPARQWPMLAVLATVGLGLLLTALDVFRIGTILVGAALLGGAVLRWLLPSVGMLAVRSRFTDIVTYGVLGTVIVLLAMMAQPDPWLKIPFLKDTLHFTVSS